MNPPTISEHKGQKGIKKIGKNPKDQTQSPKTTRDGGEDTEKYFLFMKKILYNEGYICKKRVQK